ncbi:hypothetical protein, partial [Streptomyces sp. YPW6]|uniref:hypothetical protein n=1 Tax=Streptomyces sp. YPW6 TaxID=2840373 RepID=UPI003F4A3DA5
MENSLELNSKAVDKLGFGRLELLLIFEKKWASKREARESGFTLLVVENGNRKAAEKASKRE